MSEFDYDGQENEVMGRKDFKNQSQKLIDSREKKTKKRKIKKKQLLKHATDIGNVFFTSL